MLFLLLHIVGFLTSIKALLEPRTAQGTVAWAISLNTIPYFAIPAYWLFGRTKFSGYVAKRQAGFTKINPLASDFTRSLSKQKLLSENLPSADYLLERLTALPATLGNDVQLLHNGEEIFSSILAGIDAAQKYILVQFYIVRDDELGRQVQQHLLAAAARNVSVSFIYDAIGSYQLPASYTEKLENGGVAVQAFNSTRHLARRFQINFRNHRKIVVVDGLYAWAGGSNLGDEYLGHDPRYSPWVDTAVKIIGPAAQLLQVPFLEDWHWASEGELLALNWHPQAAPSGTSQKVFCLPSGPADLLETCSLYFLNAIHNAKARIWIASPYFVPDKQIISALQLAALKGVEVRIIVPEKCDQPAVKLASWSFIKELTQTGVQFYQHTHGFMHHKLMLIDRHSSSVGSANFDNRSFDLNFEITVNVLDQGFARQLEAIFEEDFTNSRLLSENELAERSFLFRLIVRTARLFAPML